MRSIMRTMAGLLGRMAAPVAEAPLLMALVALCCAAAPLSAIALGGEHRLRFLAYALAHGCAWGWLACALTHGHRVARSVVAAFFLLFAAVEAGHYALVQHVIDADSARLALNTDAVEVRGFFGQFFGPGAWLATALAALAIAAIAWLAGRARKINIPLWAATVLLCVSACGAVGIGQMLTVLGAGNYAQLVNWQSRGSDNPELCYGMKAWFTDPLSKAVILGRTLWIEDHNFKQWSLTQRRIYEDTPQRTAPADSLHIVMVIGESFIRSHSSLYGYPLPVNPCLKAECDSGALTIFTDAISPANFTVLSLANTLNLNSTPRGEKWHEAAYFPMLFARAGWEVELFTNQYSPDSRTDLGSIFFDPLMTDSVYTRHNAARRPYDGDFLSAMVDSFDLASPGPRRTLTIWHLRGQHFPPANQLPAASRRPFSAADIRSDAPWLTDERRAIVADYANATLYNDSILGAIIDLYRSRPAILFYFSDHGEEMWDSAPFGNRNRQRPDDPDWMRRQHDVPMVAWLSPALMHRRPALADSLHRAAARPYMTDAIGHTLLGIAGIPTSRRDTLDVLSPSYRPVPRVTAQGYPYPEK